MLWRPLKSHCTTHHVWERGRELPKKCLKSYRSHSLARFVHFRSASIIIRVCTQSESRMNLTQRNPAQSTNEARRMYEIATSILFFVSSLFKFPFCYCFVHETIFFVIDFFFFCAVSGLGQVSMCFFFPLCFKWRFTWGKILQEHFKVR